MNYDSRQDYEECSKLATAHSRLPILAAAINDEHRAAFDAVGKALEHAAACGRHLFEAKDLLDHGDWLDWLEDNTEVSPRQSQKYMRLAIHWEDIAKSVPPGTHLGINRALELIADPKEKPPCCSVGEFIGEVTLIYRGWIPTLTPKGGGGPWPSDIAAFYAEHGKIGPPLEVLTWQKKAAEFHWRDWQPKREWGSHTSNVAEDRRHEDQIARSSEAALRANLQARDAEWERQAEAAKNQLNTSANGWTSFNAGNSAAAWLTRNAPEQIDMRMVDAANEAAAAWANLAAELMKASTLPQDGRAEAEKKCCPHCGGPLP